MLARFSSSGMSSAVRDVEVVRLADEADRRRAGVHHRRQHVVVRRRAAGALGHAEGGEAGACRASAARRRRRCRWGWRRASRPRRSRCRARRAPARSAACPRRRSRRPGSAGRRGGWCRRGRGARGSCSIPSSLAGRSRSSPAPLARAPGRSITLIPAAARPVADRVGAAKSRAARAFSRMPGAHRGSSRVSRCRKAARRAIARSRRERKPSRLMPIRSSEAANSAVAPHRRSIAVPDPPSEFAQRVERERACSDRRQGSEHLRRHRLVRASASMPSARRSSRSSFVPVVQQDAGFVRPSPRSSPSAAR